MTDIEPERLPPPPFWRTRYFEHSVAMRPDRRSIDPAMIVSVLEHPYRMERQSTGRIRYWGLVPTLNRWLRVVTLADGETVHTAFLDRDFLP
ncbi:MAG TPA: hypothetical protein VMD53_17745 [Rhizomicrobium sp.]|nr:hypothetical protein [Rhizomicrobium sp.]